MSHSSSPEPPSFIAHPLCPPHLRQLVEDTIQSFDDAWLLPPQDGELFDSGKACLDRLQGFILSRGFAVVTTSSTAGRYRFGYIHRSKETKNWRKLEDHIQKDSKSKQIVSNRQKEKTSQNARSCDWEMYWSIRSVGKWGSGQVVGQLGITRNAHNHVFVPNPFIYKVYQKATSQYKEAVDLTLGHRLTYQLYLAMWRILDNSGLSIDRKTYYNLIRGKLLE